MFVCLFFGLRELSRVTRRVKHECISGRDILNKEVAEQLEVDLGCRISNFAKSATIVSLFEHSIKCRQGLCLLSDEPLVFQI